MTLRFYTQSSCHAGDIAVDVAQLQAVLFRHGVTFSFERDGPVRWAAQDQLVVDVTGPSLRICRDAVAELEGGGLLVHRVTGENVTLFGEVLA